MAISPERYIQLPKWVEAIEITEENLIEVAQWCGGIPIAAFLGSELPRFIAMEGKENRASVGDWIIKDGDDSFLIVTPGCFTSLYTKPKEHADVHVQ